MFPIQRIVNQCSKLGTFSPWFFVQKKLNSPSTATVFWRLENNPSYQCYCLKSDTRVANLDPSSSISEEYKVQECTDHSPSSADSEVKFNKFKERCLSKIQKSLKCSYSQSSDLYKLYPNLFHDNIGDSMKKIATFTNAGILEKSLLKNVEVLELDDDEIIFKLEELNAWGLNIQQKNDMLALLKLELCFFEKMARLYSNGKHQMPINRFIYCSDVLHCTLEETVDITMKYRHLLTRDFQRLKETFEILLDFGISWHYIRNNLWMTTYGLESLRKWTNCSTDTRASRSHFDKQMIAFFQKLAEREKSKQNILKLNQTRAEFLAEKLQIDLKLMKYLISRHPRTFNQDLRHITEVLDFLYTHGYTNIQICTNLLVLNSDISFLKNRLKESECFGFEKLPLSILHAEKSKYQKYCGR